MKKLFLALSLFSLTIGTASADFVGNGSGGSIPDAGPGGVPPGLFTDSINVALPQNEIISDVSVTLTGLSHTWAGDLVVTLEGPGGSMDLMVRPGALTSGGDSSDFNGDYRFIDSGANLWTTLGGLTGLEAVPSGDYFASDATGQPNSFATTFGGSTTNGLWTLTITDNSFGDIGSLTSWTLNLTSTAIPEPTSLGLMGLAGFALACGRRRR